MLLAILILLIAGFTGCRQASEDTTTTSTGGGDPTQTTAPVVAGSAAPGQFALCSDCHARLDASVGKDGVLVAAFSHSYHLEGGASCDDCHLVPTHRSEGIVKPTMAKCFGCHSQEPGSPPGECDACHPADFPLVPSSHGDTDWLPGLDRLDDVRAKHSIGGLESPEECSACHSRQFCADCHAVEMPHSSDWQATHASSAREVGGDACGGCHPTQALCNECHHKEYDAGGLPWKQGHPGVVSTGGVMPCFQCHNSSTCAHCHTTGQYKSF